MDTATSTAFNYLLAQGGVPAAIIIGAVILGRVLVPFLDRVATSWEKFLNGLQLDIKAITTSLESVGSSLRDGATQQKLIVEEVQAVDGKVNGLCLDMARLYEILREQQPSGGGRGRKPLIVETKG